MPCGQQFHACAARLTAPVLHISRLWPEPKPAPQNSQTARCGNEAVTTPRTAGPSSWSRLPTEDHDPARQAAAQFHRPAPAGFLWLEPSDTVMPAGPASVDDRPWVVRRSPSLETRLSS